jgi:peptidoglycan/xylan/chitin deacetylase (PgdA/CDA1 family)
MHLAPLYPILYKVLQPAFPGCLWSGNPEIPQISLTFDDGPHPQYTPELLEVLDDYGIPASFFLLGDCVHRNPAIAKLTCEQGHWIGLHGYTHRPYPCFPAPAFKQSLAQAQSEIAQACQLATHQVRDVRPPYGVFTPQILKQLHQWHYRPVMWSVVPEDWRSPGVAVVVQRVLRQVTSGSLIVLHDGSSGGQDVAKITRQLIPPLLDRGYKFVTVNQLWA